MADLAQKSCERKKKKSFFEWIIFFFLLDMQKILIK